MLSRILCYLTIINAKLGDDEHHYKCSKYNLSFATNFYWAMFLKMPKLENFRGGLR